MSAWVELKMDLLAIITVSMSVVAVLISILAYLQTKIQTTLWREQVEVEKQSSQKRMEFWKAYNAIQGSLERIKRLKSETQYAIPYEIRFFTSGILASVLDTKQKKLQLILTPEHINVLPLFRGYVSEFGLGKDAVFVGVLGNDVVIRSSELTPEKIDAFFESQDEREPSISVNYDRQRIVLPLIDPNMIPYKKAKLSEVERLDEQQPSKHTKKEFAMTTLVGDGSRIQLTFKCEPAVIWDCYLPLNGVFSSIAELKLALLNLHKSERTIRVLDQSIVDDMKRLYGDLLISLVDSFKNSHTLQLDAKTTSSDIQTRLISMMGLECLRRTWSKIDTDLVDRLTAAQRRAAELM
jgi:hypothetical protein